MGPFGRAEFTTLQHQNEANKSQQALENAVKKFLQGVVGLVALGMAVPAFAADLPVAYSRAPVMMPALYDWSGFYLGLNAGWGSSQKCLNQNTGLNGTFFASDGCNTATGGLAGAQAGYRWQASSWVFGVEGQGDWTNLRGSATSQILGAPFVNQTRVDAVGLFTGQIGYAINTVLLYVKGGGAVTSDRYYGFNTATATLLDNTSETRWGGAVGAGVEVSFVPDWSAAVEYDHLFMGSHTQDFYSTITPGTFTREDVIRQGVDMVTLRVNYRWGGPVIAKY
jgi:outer membrane immunogenic protein